MHPIIKICGITDPSDASFCAEAGADALGFIFYERSPRYIEPSAARRIIQQFPSTVMPVGVFVNEERKRIETIAAFTGIDVIQLSGDESPEDCRHFDRTVWKAVRFKVPSEVVTLDRYEVAAAILDGASDGMYGGSGTLANFDIARRMKIYCPVIIAGGLNPDNVLDAIGNIHPYGIDVNSGVESHPGKKDHKKIQQLFEKVLGRNRS